MIICADCGEQGSHRTCDPTVTNDILADDAFRAYIAAEAVAKGASAMTAYYDTAVLPVEEFINPSDVSNSPAGSVGYADDSSVLYVMMKLDDSRTRPTRVLGSSGDLGPEWNLETEHELRHDQTGARLGRYKVVGVSALGGKVKIGDVPYRLIHYAVFK